MRLFAKLMLAVALLLAGLAPAAAQKRIALTFDDVPRGRGAFLTPDERTVKLIAGLRRAGVPQAAFFVNPANLGNPDGKGGEERILAYVAAGHVIANHSWSHPHLSETSAADFLANIDRADAWLRPRDGFRPWFRFPFLDEGMADKAKRDAVRAGLKARGLHNGYVTADGADWFLEQLTIDAAKAGKPIDMAALRDLYVETHVGAAEFFDGLMVKAIGRSPIHVMLMHETDLAALFLPDLVAALRAKGWEIVTADAAFADPVNQLFPDTPSANGTLTEAVAWEKNLPAPRWYERNSTKLLGALFAARVLHEGE
ncbi:polysaccharide deacetylase family protein [Sphingomonas canadensis]|uniref:Chitooligosaccharide deacetylase n=1 Tax=Sphingomonas canadensis TaxID=1219257 RepID=A0ABW3H9L7_9SPHN|nr:polysaccharide deacetylase family protein [Sphingomonas canadensis]MCW3836371.1 polysaccharide deacetylase family protein [Sphingomonas canadensis]